MKLGELAEKVQAALVLLGPGAEVSIDPTPGYGYEGAVFRLDPGQTAAGAYLRLRCLHPAERWPAAPTR